MSKKRVTEVLAAHAESLIGLAEHPEQPDLTDRERSEVTPLFQLAERLHANMQPVQPPVAFIRSLKEELVEHARQHVAVTMRVRRSVLIGAAALGSILSVASVVGALLILVPRLRARTQARVAQLPTG